MHHLCISIVSELLRGQHAMTGTLSGFGFQFRFLVTCVVLCSTALHACLIGGGFWSWGRDVRSAIRLLATSVKFQKCIAGAHEPSTVQFLQHGTGTCEKLVCFALCVLRISLLQICFVLVIRTVVRSSTPSILQNNGQFEICLWCMQHLQMQARAEIV